MLCFSLAKSICTWYDQLWWFMFCFPRVSGKRGRLQSGNGKAPDKRDVRRSHTATRMPELARKTRKSNACFAGYERVNSSLVWHWVTQPNVHPKTSFQNHMEGRWCGDTDALLNRIGQLVLARTFFLSFFLSFQFFFNQPIVKKIKNMGSPCQVKENPLFS